MKKKVFFILMQLLVFSLFASEKINLAKFKVLKMQDFKVALFDKHEHSGIDIKDSEWELFDFHNNNIKGKGIIWIRKTMEFSGELKKSDPIVLSFYNFSPAYEVYWDGEKIGADGVLGKNGELIKSSKVRNLIPLSRDIVSKGIHTISLRIYFTPKFIAGDRSFYLINKKYLDTFVKNIVIERIYFFGFFFVITFFCISLYITGLRNLSYLYFGIYTGFFCIVNLWNYLIESEFISTIVFRFLDPLLRNSDGILGMILILFLIWHYNIQKKKYYILASTILLFFSIILLFATRIDSSLSEIIILIIFNILGVLIIIKGIKKKIPGSFIALFSFIFLTLIYSLYIVQILRPEWRIIDFSINKFVDTIFLLTLLLAIIVKIQSENKKFNEIQLHSKRMEAEMLKKSIQPHFILNTLLSLKSLIRTGGDKAELLIDSLANEFNIIRDISTENKIKLKRELELCRLHLKIMGLRREAEYKLKCNCIYENLLIPPLLIHTQIENGITHSFKPKENGIFELTCTKSDSLIRLSLTNSGSKNRMGNQTRDEDIKERTGIKYIRTRLNETYEQNWKLSYGIEENTWAVEISIPFEEEK